MSSPELQFQELTIVMMMMMISYGHPTARDTENWNSRLCSPDTFVRADIEKSNRIAVITDYIMVIWHYWKI